MHRLIPMTMDIFKSRVATLRRSLDSNVGLMLLIAVVFFGSAILNLQEDNRALLEGQNEQRSGRIEAVENIVRDSNENTTEILERIERVERLTCGILLLHDPELTRQLSAELVDLCENELTNRGNTDNSSSHSSDGHSHGDSGEKPQNKQNDETEPNKKPAEEQPTDEERGIIETIINMLGDIL